MGKKRGRSVAVKDSKETKLLKSKELPLLKRILGDEFLAVSAIILFLSFMKMGFRTYSMAITLFIIATFSFIAGVSIKNYIKDKY